MMHRSILLLYPAVLFASGAIAYFWWRLQSGYRSPRALSESARTAMASLEGRVPDFDNAWPSLSAADLCSIYSNSRIAVLEAHRLILLYPGSPFSAELAASLQIAEDRHRRLVLLVLMACLERMSGILLRTRLPLYARALLWTYGEVIEAVDQMARECGDAASQSLLARL